MAFVLHNVVVKVVHVVYDVVPQRSGRSRLKFEHNWVAVFVFTLSVDLGAKQHLSYLHVPVVVLLYVLIRLCAWLGLSCEWIEHVM